MAKKTGLGKGLDALFANNLTDEEIKENEVIEKLKMEVRTSKICILPKREDILKQICL